MRIAAIDIGTNSIHMVIVRSTGADAFEVVDREREVVQIGRGSFTGLRLRSDAIRRTVAALTRFVRLARSAQADRILCTATAAVREARNGGEFIAAARAACGVAPRVIPAEEEGRLIYLAVRRALELDGRPSLLVDIGGGSMQLVVCDRERLLLATSAPLGALRLHEQFPAADPPARRDLQRLRRHIRRHARGALERVAAHRPVRVIGTSGAIHALAQVAHWDGRGRAIEHLNGHRLTRESLLALTRALAGMDEAGRQALRGLDPRRAEIILPGALVLAHVLEETGAEEVTLSDFGVREGLVSDFLEFHAAEISALDPGADLQLRSVLALLHKFQGDGRHARHVAALSLALFDGLARRHALDADARELLHYAALLHDVGSAIGFDGHAEHSRYIILNGNLRGLTADQIAIVANVARYHGRNRPRKGDPRVKALRKRDRRTVRWLAAMLRVAEGLDRSHYQLVRGLAVRRRRGGWVLEVRTRRDAQLELWAAGRRLALLERLLGQPVRIREAPAAVRSARRGPPRRTARGAPALAVVPRPPAPAGSEAPPRAPARAPRAGRAGRAAPRRRAPSRGASGGRDSA